MRILRGILLGVAGLLALAWVGLVTYAYWPGAAEIPARQLAGADDRFVDVNGLAIRYRAYGEPAAGKPDLILLHGFANSLQSFRLLAPRLADSYRVVAMDMPGFGLSAKPVEHDYHNGAQARVVMDFATALGMQRYIVGGHSLGGTIALHVAVTDPRVSGLVLMNPGIITTGVPPITQYLFFPLPRVMARIFGTREFRERFLRQSFVNQGIVTEQVMEDMMLAPRSEGYLDGMTSLMGQYVEGEELALLAQVRVPTLIVWGMQDKSKKPTELDELLAMLPGAVAVRVQKSGHYVHEEQPQQVATAMIAALARWQ
jgi:pimeloyl-ACP methyl ester carboxylesterase